MTNQTTMKKELVPAKAIHPGEVLKDELTARGMKQKELAQVSGIQATQLNEIIKGKRGINAEQALAIGAALDMDPVLWANLQANYELNKARLAVKTSRRLQAIDLWKTVKQYIPVPYLRKQGVLKGDPLIDISLIKKIYTVANIEELIALFSQPKFARFRKSEKLAVEKINLLGWQHLAMHYAAEKKVEVFDPTTEGNLIAEVNNILYKNKNVVVLTEKALNKTGIKFLILEKPDKCPVDGISFMSGANPAIVLTMRHKRLDNFAFTLMHELGHVYRHLLQDQEAVFIDIDPKEEDKAYLTSKEELEADAFAKEALIPACFWKEFSKNPEYKTMESVQRFAIKNNVHPDIVKGKIRFETGDYKLFGKMEEVG